MRIYTTDRNIPFKSTRLSALESKADIDGLLARWGIKQYEWIWDPDNERIELRFQIREMVKDIDGIENEILPIVIFKCYPIWNKKTNRKYKEDSINWSVSMRAMFWGLKASLLKAHLFQTSKARQFLDHIEIPGSQGKTIGDVLVHNMSELKALPGV